MWGLIHTQQQDTSEVADWESVKYIDQLPDILLLSNKITIIFITGKVTLELFISHAGGEESELEIENYPSTSASALTVNNIHLKNIGVKIKRWKPATPPKENGGNEDLFLQQESNFVNQEFLIKILYQTIRLVWENILKIFNRSFMH